MNAIACSKDNNIFIAANISDTSVWPVITKISEDGNIIWRKQLYFNLNKSGFWHTGNLSVIADDNNGCIVSSVATKTTISGSETYLVLSKLDEDGNLLWSKKYAPVPLGIEITNMVLMPDNVYCLITEIGELGNVHPLIIQIDANGKEILQKKITRPLSFFNYDFTVGYDALSDPFGNIYISGKFFKSTGIDQGLDSAFIMKIDKNIKVQWIKVLKDTTNVDKLINSEILSLALSQKNNIVFSGSTRSRKNIIGSMDSYGNLLWVKTSKLSNGQMWRGNLKAATDSGFYYISNSNFFNGFITKYNKDGALDCNQKDTSLDFYDVPPVSTQNVYFSGNNCFVSKDYFDNKILDVENNLKMHCGKEFYPISDLEEDTILCKAAYYTLRAGKDNLGYNHKFTWSTGSTDSVLTVTQSGKYWLAISSGYCTNTDTVNIIFRDEIKSSIPDQSICPYDSVLIKSSDIPAAKFYWIKPDKSIFIQHDIWARDTGTYYLMLEGNGNCLNIDTFRLQHHNLPKASAGPDTTICYNQSYEMQGKGGISYKWIPAKYLSNDTIANPIATAPDIQLYILVVKNAFGCADTSQMWLKVKPKLEVKIQAQSTSYCNGEKVVLQAKATGGDSLHYTYKWNNSDNKEAEFTTTLKQSGWVKITLEDGCSEPAKDSIFITVKPTPIAAFYTSPLDTAIEGNKVQFINQSIFSNNYIWNFGNGETSNATNPNYIYTDTGKYFITLIAQNSNGCTDTAFGNIYIGEKLRIYIPNAFTPDGDLINDVFSVYGTGIKHYSYEIYNRWGQRIFTSSTNNLSWNGAVENRGETVQMDVYFYVLKVRDTENRTHYFNGTVNVIK